MGDMSRVDHTSRLWVTNDRIAAAKLKAADNEYKRAREAAQGLCLADKLDAYRIAQSAWERAYSEVANGTSD